MNEIINIVKKYTSFFKIQKRSVIIMAISTTIGVGLLALEPVIFSTIVDSLSNNNKDIIFIYIYLFLFVGIATKLVWSFILYLKEKTFKKNYQYAEALVLEKISSMKFMHYSNVERGKLVTIAIYDTVRISSSFNLIIDLLIYAFKIGIIFIILFIIDFKTALITLAFLIIYVILIKNYSYRKYGLLKKEDQYCDNMTERVIEIIDDKNNIDEVKNLPILMSQYKRNNKSFLKTNLEALKIDRILEYNIDIISVIGQFFIMAFLCIFLFRQKLLAEEFLIIIGYYTIIFTDIKEVIKSFTKLLYSDIAISKIIDLLNFDTSNEIETGQIKPKEIEYSIEFNKVSSNYNKKVILDNISFKLNPRNVNMIIGSTNSGKSAILMLLNKDIKLQYGKIKIGNIPIYDIDEDYYKNIVTFYNMYSFDYKKTINENIEKYGDNNTETLNIIKQYLHFPKNICDVILEKEEQTEYMLFKLKLLRTLLTNSKILLFDEINLNNNKISDLITKLDKIYTIVITTKNKYHLIHSDNVIYLNSGKIIYKGNYENLIKNDLFDEIN